MLPFDSSTVEVDQFPPPEIPASPADLLRLIGESLKGVWVDLDGRRVEIQHVSTRPVWRLGAADLVIVPPEGWAETPLVSYRIEIRERTR